ncbi:MAG: hypothetical protein ATN32_01035 [Candidatus Epulonipiscium fishelsonii]|nr:MAG: hypothetical protein ATN32_01035 [Epulopiscium sp. AS2M-Bin002]
MLEFFGFEDLMVGAAIFVAMIVQGVTGFGGSVVCSSAVTSIYGPALAVPIMAMSGHPINGPLCIMQYKMIDWKSLAKIVAFALPGLLIGNFLFKTMDPLYAKIGVGAFVTIIACHGIYKAFFKEKLNAHKEANPDSTFAKVSRIGCLIVGGIAQGAFNVGGPLVTVFALSAVKDKSRFRATMCMFWMVLNSVTMFNHWAAGFWTTEFWIKFGINLPFMIGGFLVGCFLHNKLNQQLFLKIVYIVLFFVGGQMFLSNVMTLI